MHHLAVKRSNLVDAHTGQEASQLYSSPPLWPKPRRVGSSAPEFIKSLGCGNHSQLNSDGRNGVLNLIISENTEGCAGGGQWASGSLPGRASNPMVRDVQFTHQLQQYPPFSRSSKLPGNYGVAAAFD